MSEPTMRPTADQTARLHAEHRRLHGAVAALSRRAHLTPAEQSTLAALKRRKLDAKDRLHALVRGGRP